MTTYSVIRADEIFRDDTPHPRVFLGGSCKGRDWRLDFFHRFEQAEVTFINPKREHFSDPEMDPAGHISQVSWDREAIDKAEIVIFWLGEGLSNQASRVEIGYAIGKGKTVLIGADDSFLGMEHLTAFSGLVVSSSLEGLMNRFSSLYASYKL